MRKIINSFFQFFILGLASIACSTDEIIPESSSPISNIIPNEYQGVWKVKYRDHLDVSSSGSYLRFTSYMAKVYYSHSTESYDYTSNAFYKNEPQKQILMIMGITIDILPSLTYPGYTEFVIRKSNTNSVVDILIAQKE